MLDYNAATAVRTRSETVPVPVLRPSTITLDHPHVRVLDGGQHAFEHLIGLAERAETSIDVRVFIWRDDQSGNRFGRALLAAANRGVKVTIHKDRVGANYEYYEGSRQSFFHKAIAPVHRIQVEFLRLTRGGKGSYRQDSNALAEALLKHPNVTVVCDDMRYDHSKVFIFDERIVVVGGMGIGDDHCRDWLDIMVEVESERLVQRLERRLSGGGTFDPRRKYDFLLHDVSGAAAGSCPMLADRLALIDEAEKTLWVEMAYFGDKRFTAALTRAVNRGVDVTVITSLDANILGHVNRRCCDAIYRATTASRRLRVVSVSPMVHSKAVVADGRFVDVGSANFTPLSHGTYTEVNFFADDVEVAEQLQALMARHAAHGETIRGDRVPFNLIVATVERLILAYQSRRGPSHDPSL